MPVWRAVVWVVLGIMLADATPLIAQTGPDARLVEQRLSESVKYLASDELEGRGITTNGIDRAAEYLAAQFTGMGLDTKRYNGTPFHTFHMNSRFELGSTNSLAMSAPKSQPIELNCRVDFIPLSLSGSGKIDLPLAFVGYGISAPKLNYDDYQGLNVSGRAVIVLRNEPLKNHVNSPFDGTEATEFAYVSHKIQNAIQHGAAAVLLVTDRGSLDSKSNGDQNDPDPLMAFEVKSSAGNRQIPVLHCKRAAVEPLLKSVDISSLSKLEQDIDGDLKPRSMLLPACRVKGEVSVVRNGKPLKNVVAVLPGHGPLADETIIVGAHYDHLGYGGAGSLAWLTKKEIHNGADDNGSGTAVLVEVARQLAATSSRQPLRRRIVFIAFTAEESGLIGSEKYVADPLVPLKQTVAMLNLDMVGRLREEKLTVYGTGTATEFDSLIDRLGSAYGFAIVKRPGGYGPSDHATFYERGIPVLHFFTGLHKQYHRPEDDADLLNVPGMARISRLVVEAVEELANASQRPTHQKVSGGDDLDGLFNALLGMDDSGPVNKSKPGKRTEGQPYLGITTAAKPGHKPAQPGYVIDLVRPGGPADDAGLKSGDRITQFGDLPITTADDLLAALTKSKPGQKVRLQLQRSSIDIEIEATIGAK